MLMAEIFSPKNAKLYRGKPVTSSTATFTLPMPPRQSHVQGCTTHKIFSGVDGTPSKPESFPLVAALARFFSALDGDRAGYGESPG
jgi:hypothetical protein